MTTIQLRNNLHFKHRYKMRDKNELALFAGHGGGILGTKLLGYRCVCAVEQDQYARSVLLQRQNDGLLSPFPIWDDVTTFDGTIWRGRIDLVSGGFPCQDISSAGQGAGIDGAKSSLWLDMARIIDEVRPALAFMENSPLLTLRGLDRVLADLAALGYAAEWGTLGAIQVGAPHHRQRIWILAADEHNSDFRISSGPRRWSAQNLADSESQRLEERSLAGRHSPRMPTGRSWWSTEPGMDRVAHGIPSRMDRIKGLGNAQIPLVAAHAFRQLAHRLGL